MIGPRRVDNKPLVLYGAGKLGRLAGEIFNRLGILFMVIDKDTNSPYPVPGPDILVAVCVATSPYNEIKGYLERLGYEDIVPVWDVIEAYPEVGLHNGWFGEKINKQGIISFWHVHNNLTDVISKIHYIAFKEWAEERKEPLALTPTPSDEFLTVSLSASLDEICSRKRMSVYNQWVSANYWQYFHNEGMELESVWYRMDYLKKDRPKIAVACYHSQDGLWRIEKLLMDNLKDYNFYFRLHAYMGQAAYMYCIPKEMEG